MTLIMLSLPANLLTDEVEKHSMYVCPPIPFVLIHESAGAATKPKTTKLLMDGGKVMSYPIWSGDTPKGLLCHVQSALDICKQCGIQKAYYVAVLECKQALAKISDTKLLIEECINSRLVLVKRAKRKKPQSSKKQFPETRGSYKICR